MKTYPLTETQLGMYLEWDADRSSTQYNAPAARRGHFGLLLRSRSGGVAP